MYRPRIHWLLRIAFSAVCLLFCAASTGLWVRTQYSCDTVHGPIQGACSFVVTSRQGGLGFGCHTDFLETWDWHTLPPHTLPSATYKSALVVELYRSPAKDFFVVRFPYWFLIVVAATCAAASWFNRLWRFSLRTLLIAATVVAVVLGLIDAFC
jgi:hypothetical protein